MIFNFIRFENYRPYYGDQTLQFRREDHQESVYRKNIVLVGGLNGAGKTSLINAFYICLYGRRKFSKAEYEIIKKEAINNHHKRDGGRKSRIQLGFSDETGDYVIEISFSLNHKDEVQESRKIFSVGSDGIRRDSAIAEEEFNEFIDQRIPIDVAPFFIFDAEKIRDLVGEQDKEETVQAIQKVVSLELYKTLQTDLRDIRLKASKNYSKSINDTELQNMVNEIEEIAVELEQNREKEKAYTLRISELQEEKGQVSQARRKKFAENSQTKKQINNRIVQLVQDQTTIQNNLELFGRSSLPTMILSPLIKELKTRIRAEQNYLDSLKKNEIAFAPYEKFIEQLFAVKLTPPLNEYQKHILHNQGKELWTKVNRVYAEKVEPMTVLHDLSQGDRYKLNDWATPVEMDIRKLIDRRYSVEKQLAQLNAELENAPEVIDTQEEDDRLEAISQELGSLYTLRKTCTENIRKLQDRHARLTKELTFKRDKRNEFSEVEGQLELLSRLIEATQEFVDQVTVLKAEQLKSEIEAILPVLFRKDDFDRVEFDPSEFTLKIFNRAAEMIELNSRSEGEKQLIALAMIWALTKVAGTNFPFVIDTPLARLDSIHRSNVVNRYFTNLSDQVIILSTDTEVTKEFVEEIEPYVQVSYLLEYDNDEESTKITEGYFQFA